MIDDKQMIDRCQIDSDRNQQVQIDEIDGRLIEKLMIEIQMIDKLQMDR